MPRLELEGQPGTGVAEDIIARLLPEWWSRFQPKNAAYGGALAVGGGLGIKAFIPEINRKVQGIINEVWHDETPQEGAEGAREKAMDLIGHLLILISNLDAKAEGGPRAGFDKAAIVDRAFGVSRAARLSGEDGKAAGLAHVDRLVKTPERDGVIERCCNPSNDWWHTADCPVAGYPAIGGRVQAGTPSPNDGEIPVKQCPSKRHHEAHYWFTPGVSIHVWCDGLLLPPF